MSKTRSILELLKILRVSIRNTKSFRFMEGLCLAVRNLVANGEITFEEYLRLNRFIEKHEMPSWKRYYTNGAHWWKRGVKAPRLRWLDEHIRKLSK